MFLLWHPWLTTTNLSYSFPLLETSATALCGTTGILQKSSTWVSWARMSIVEYKHHQFEEPGMQHIWCPNPYCRLLCAQFLQACTKQSAKDDFWFRLWHYFDQYKDEANRSTNRLSPAHEINLTFAVHHTLLDSNLRLIMKNKIVKGSGYPDVSNWTLQLGVLEKILSNWPEWQDKPSWNHTPMIVMKYLLFRPFLGVMRQTWRVVSKSSTPVAFDLQPPLMNQAAPTIGVHHSIVVSMVSWLTSRLTTKTTSNLQNKQSYIAEGEHRMSIVRLLSMELPMLVNVIWQSAQVAQQRNIRPVFSMMWFMDMHTVG